MIVCCCRAITDREIDSAIQAGATSVEAVGALLGAGTDCGCCQEEIASRVERGCGNDCATCPNRAANDRTATEPTRLVALAATAA